MLHLSMMMQATIVSQIIVIDWTIFYIMLLKSALEVDNVLAGRTPAGDIVPDSDECAEIFQTQISAKEN